MANLSYRNDSTVPKYTSNVQLLFHSFYHDELLQILYSIQYIFCIYKIERERERKMVIVELWLTTVQYVFRPLTKA